MSPRPLLLAAVVLATSACSQAHHTTLKGPVGGGTATTPVSATEAPRTKGSLVATAAGPVGLTVDTRGRVWVANADAGTVSRINAAGDRVDVSRRVGSAPLRLAATPGSVWVTVFSDGVLLRLDDVTGKITKTVQIGAEPEGLTAAFGSVWVVRQASSELLRVDPDTGRTTHRYRVGVAPRQVTAGHGALWVSDFGSGRLFRVNPGTGTVRQSGALCSGPQGMLVTPHAVWVACTTDNVLVGVDPDTLELTSRLALPGAPDGVTAGPGGQVLVALQKGPTLAVIDPAGPAVVRRDRLGSVDQLDDRANIDVVYTGNQAWVSSYLEGGVYRVSP